MDRYLVCRTIAVILLILGVLLCISTTPAFRYLVDKELKLTPSSKTFSLWKDTPVPITLDFYFFNWTNPHELLHEGFKPDLVQMGPYRFKEVHEKVNITWNDDDTVSYKQVKRWYYDPQHSNGSLKDNVTTLNPVALSAASVSRFRSVFMQVPLSGALRMTGQQVWVTKTVGEFLFDGYSDPILTMAMKMPHLAQADIQVDRFGWFYMRNGSADFEGVFTMETGVQDINRLGKLSLWNEFNRTKYYESECGMVNGSAGELFPPRLSRNSVVEMFSSDLCRSIRFEYAREVQVEGIDGYRYELGGRLLDNGTLDPDNWCNCGGDCVPQGALNVSTCRHGAPAFVSYPHFLDADPYYSDKLRGMRPDPLKHTFYLTLEPNTGIPLDVAARLQINLLLQHSDSIAMYNDVPTIFFPMLWFEERATMTPELAAELKLLLKLPAMVLGLAIGIILVGAVLLFAGISNLKVARSQNWRPTRICHMRRKDLNSTQVVYSKEQIRPLMNPPEPVPASPAEQKCEVKQHLSADKT